MHLIDIEADEAADMIAEMTKHLPPGASLGRVRVVTPAGVLAAYGDGTCVWGLGDSGAWRQLDLGDGLHEVTTWYWGDEEIRRIVRTSEDPQQP